MGAFRSLTRVGQDPAQLAAADQAHTNFGTCVMLERRRRRNRAGIRQVCVVAEKDVVLKRLHIAGVDGNSNVVVREHGARDTRPAASVGDAQSSNPVASRN